MTTNKKSTDGNDSVVEQAVNSALQDTHETLGATPAEIFYAALAATVLGFILVNLDGTGPFAEYLGYVLMVTGGFTVYALRSKI